MRTFRHFILTATTLLVVFLALVVSSSSTEIQQLRMARSHVKRSLDQWAAIGSAQKSSGHFAPAAQAFELAEAEAGWIGLDKDRIPSLMALGVVYWDLGEIGKSRLAYERAQSLCGRLGLRVAAEQCRLALSIDRLYRDGKDFDEKKDYCKSIAAFENAAKLARKLGSPDHEAKCLRLLGTAYFDRGDLGSFFKLTQQALTLYERQNNDREKAYCLYNLGTFYERESNFPQALKYVLQSLGIVQKNGLLPEEADCLCYLGSLFAKIGYLHKAIDYHLSAESMLRRSSIPYDYQVFYANLGLLYRRRATLSGNKKDLEIALSYYYSALDRAWRKGDEESEALILNNIGFALFHLGRYPEALRILRSGFAKASRIHSNENMVLLLVNEGHVLFAQQDIGGAKQFYESSLRLWNRTGSGPPPWDALWGRGRCLEKLQNYRGAEASYRNCIDLVDTLRGQLALETDRAEFLQGKLAAYESLIGLIFGQHQVWPVETGRRLIFSLIEKAKARSFMEGIQRPGSSGEKSPSAEFALSEKMLSLQISSLMKSLLSEKTSSDQREKILARLCLEEENYSRLQNPVDGAEVPKPAVEPLCLEKVQDFLNKTKSGVVEFFLGSERSYLALVTGHSLGVWSLPSRGSIETSIKLYIKMLSSPPVQAFQCGSAARRLFDELLFPLRHISPGEIENLVIVPDGLLHYLPFETLSSGRDPASGRDHLLLQDFNISYAPSITSLIWITTAREEYHHKKGLLALGNPDYGSDVSPIGHSLTTAGILREVFLDQGFSFCPLPHTQTEIENISGSFRKGAVDTFLGAQASEDRVKRADLTDYRMIHFACHGFLDERNPQRSALILSQSGNSAEDGFLQAREILNLRTRADLVVLSACQTGKGCLERGEGLLGITRVFFMTGAKSILSALWTINDESTSIFMKDFYSGLRRGLSKSRALREAKLTMMSSRYGHPFYWAPFILNGEFYSAIDLR